MELKDAAAGFGALAQTTRLMVLRELVTSGHKGMPAGELAEAVGTPSSTLSFHLKELLAAKMVTSRRDGRQIIYQANFSGLRELIEFLIQDCCANDPSICEVSGIDAFMREDASVTP